MFNEELESKSQRIKQKHSTMGVLFLLYDFLLNFNLLFSVLSAGDYCAWITPVGAGGMRCIVR